MAAVKGALVLLTRRPSSGRVKCKDFSSRRGCFIGLCEGALGRKSHYPIPSGRFTARSMAKRPLSRGAARAAPRPAPRARARAPPARREDDEALYDEVRAGPWQQAALGHAFPHPLSPRARPPHTHATG